MPEYDNPTAQEIWAALAPESKKRVGLAGLIAAVNFLLVWATVVFCFNGPRPTAFLLALVYTAVASPLQAAGLLRGRKEKPLAPDATVEEATSELQQQLADSLMKDDVVVVGDDEMTMVVLPDVNGQVSLTVHDSVRNPRTRNVIKNAMGAFAPYHPWRRFKRDFFRMWK